MLSLSRWLGPLYRLPAGFVTFLGAVNLAYAAYSFSLAVRQRPRQRWIAGLVIANASWGVICLSMGVVLARKASWLGLAHLSVEGLYIGWLAMAEWRANRRQIGLPTFTGSPRALNSPVDESKR